MHRSNFFVFLFFLFVSICFENVQSIDKDDLLVLSIATNQTDGYHRFIRSLKIYRYKFHILGSNEVWKGGKQKIELLRDYLKEFKDDSKKIVLVTNSYNVMMSQGAEFLLNKFEGLKPARIVFSAEDFCWPDSNLQYDYPFVDSHEKRFLNSGSFIGYASDLYQMITTDGDIDDAQLYFTKIFLNESLRTKFSIVLDKRADIFMNLNGAVDEISLPANGDDVYVQNTWTDSVPTVIIGNGAAKKTLNYLSNYIAGSWSVSKGSIRATEDLFDLMSIDDLNQWPIVFIALFIEYPTPFLREYFEKISKINYPKNRLAILIHNQVEYHKNLTEINLNKFKKDEYIFVKYLTIDDDITEGEARQQAITECRNSQCDYLFVVDSIVHLDHPDTLIQLITLNRNVLAPMLLRPGLTWSNFWGDVSDQGYYQRSADYMDLVNYKNTGLFQVPHVADCYLIKGKFLQQFTPNYIDAQFDPDVKFCQSIRDAEFFIFVDNEFNYGHLIDPSNFNISRTQPELYEIFNNVKDWKSRYLHPDYHKSLEPNATIEQPCRDVYWFPVLSKEFTESLINLVETFGEWSGSSHSDKRLAGGYENVPTDDIHMTQVDFQEHWLFILRDIIQPLQQKVFTGYYSDPPKAVLNFVVRYMPDRQNKLRPHHDASTYTMNLALNDAGIDFQGGGCRFVRQNCSITSTRRGWALLQPGRLTHLHEGLPVTGGVRYIMVSFIDP